VGASAHRGVGDLLPAAAAQLLRIQRIRSESPRSRRITRTSRPAGQKGIEQTIPRLVAPRSRGCVSHMKRGRLVFLGCGISGGADIVLR